MYKWKINMVDGKSFIVKTDINDCIEFTNLLFGIKNGEQQSDIVISHFEKEGTNNRVTIISTYISSIEWCR